MFTPTKVGKLFKHNNSRCVAPPGKLSKGKGKPIIVATLMRSGTHLLIDSLLNNCKPLRRSPLYIDLDHWPINKSTTPKKISEDILCAGNYVIKTHFPQLGGNCQRKKEVVQLLAASSTVLTMERDISAITKSLITFTGGEEVGDMARLQSLFTYFWNSRTDVNLTFDALLNNWSASMRTVWQAAELVPDQPPKPPVHRSRKNTIYFNKLLTRIMGSKAPYINTTIGFALAEKN